MVEKFKQAFVAINELVDSKTAAIGALIDLCGLVDLKLPKGQAFSDHAARAEQICDGQHYVVVQHY